MPAPSIKISFLVLLLPSQTAFAEDNPSRLIPPARVDCSYDHLTSYTGKVVEYQRMADHTELHIATDWGTLETVRLPHTKQKDSAALYLIEGKTFEPSDWQRVEISPGRLQQGVRAAAWVCSDNQLPVIDWLPPKE
ncbi:hypothetical protein [Candidatus Methylomicrobium oryzae]|jgi:hypothetical protein|uniref:hypothetical protein n=1 Tax=Candidatus Methylomicrobium oryzae TaxID=2802053 RepID=UPI00192316C6|nr:hypothetical protein [Methylomicrobium sp. RS1]MBL1264122.1 hypothetical protein [Methylomicrobium sp. RS1]